MGPRSEFSTMVTETQRRNILTSVFEGYYKETQREKVIVDTNRVWCSKLPLLAALFPDAKVIVCVRDLVWIMDSFERVLRKNALGQSKMFQPKDALTAHTRVSSLASPGGTVGFAWNATQEAFYGDFCDKLIVVDYEALTREPQRTMAAIYAKLGLPAFEHDFENVVYGEGDEFDANLGVPGLHTVGRKVRFSERPTILPPELYERFSGRNFWRRPEVIRVASRSCCRRRHGMARAGRTPHPVSTRACGWVRRAAACGRPPGPERCGFGEKRCPLNHRQP